MAVANLSCVKPLPRWKGRDPVQSDGWGPRASGFHRGSDLMWPRKPEDMGPPGKLWLPTHARRYVAPDPEAPGRLQPLAPAVSICDGEVIAVDKIGTGWRVKVRHTPRLVSGYYHLRSPRVQLGDRVKKGQAVGLVSHNPKGFKLSHLHFATWLDGKLVDPWPIIRDLPVAEMPWSPWAKIALGGAVAFVFYQVFLR